MQTKTMIRYYFPYIRIAKIQKLAIPSANKIWDKHNYQTLPVGMINGTATLENRLAVSYKVLPS